MSRKNSIAALGLLAAAVAAPAGASSWDFFALSGGVEKSLGSTYTFTQGGQTITASVWSPSPTTEQLYAKNDGSGERGIGLTPASEHEIYYPLGVELTLTGGTFSTLEVGSVQGLLGNGESYQVQASKDGTTWTTITEGIGGGGGPGHNVIDVTGLSGYTYVILDTPFADNTTDPPYGKTNGSNNIVLDSVTTTASSVPEPEVLSLLGFGLVAVAFTRRRKG